MKPGGASQAQVLFVPFCSVLDRDPGFVPVSDMTIQSITTMGISQLIDPSNLGWACPPFRRGLPADRPSGPLAAMAELYLPGAKRGRRPGRLFDLEDFTFGG
jgi:hypothetical protein